MTTVIIGVGNEYRHDDAAGILAAQQLRALAPAQVTVAESDGEPTGLLDLWDGADLAVVIDAVDSHGEPGRIYRLGLHHPAVASGAATSSHGVPLGDAVALARALDRMPARLLLYGVQISDVSAGAGLSAPVADAVRRVVAEIADLLGFHRPGDAKVPNLRETS
ncbi:MAG: hydrogenase maturation protease [Hamadaea sp.]|nr:hydrogenase maturation protease [Hamadaea sp.]